MVTEGDPRVTSAVSSIHSSCQKMGLYTEVSSCPAQRVNFIFFPPLALIFLADTAALSVGIFLFI